MKSCLVFLNIGLRYIFKSVASLKEKGEAQFCFLRDGSGETLKHPSNTSGGLQEGWKGTSYRACSDRIRGNSFKLKEGRFDMGKKLSVVRMVRP